MQIPFELALGWRYTRAGRAIAAQWLYLVHLGRVHAGHCTGGGGADHRFKRDERLPKEVRDRMLSVVSHIEIFAPMASPMQDVAEAMAQAQQHP